MENQITVRKAMTEDVKAIAEVERLSFPIPWSEQSIYHDIKENNLALVLIAEIDGSFAGYADIWCIAGEGQLNNIAVMPKMRGLHVGQVLMETMTEELRLKGITEISLEVRVSNDVARALYDKCGFLEQGRRKNYYEDNGEDALILKKEIDSNA